MYKKLFSILLWNIFYCISILSAQTLPDLSEKIPLDPAVRFGKLENGLTYYVRYNPKPQKRAELRLAVDAGSILEDENQQGLAHFCEHMAFNGTKNFEKNKLIDYLEKTGIRFGAHLNAFTSFDETVYMMQIPTDSEKVVENGFKILEDWAHNLTFDPLEIDKERGVVGEEWRLGIGADERMRKQYFPFLYKNSRYAERLPIGKKEVLDTCAYSTLKKFYTDWYRPDLMAVIAVGDFDVEKIEKLIISKFSMIPVSSNPKIREYFPVPDHDERFIVVAKDKEADNITINITYKLPKFPEGTVNDYRRNLIFRLVTGMLNERLSEIQKEADPPFSFAFTFVGDFARTKDSFTSIAFSKENSIEKCFETIARELERMRRHGFTAGELEREKKDLNKGLESRHVEKDKTESATFVWKLVSLFLDKNPAPSIEYEFTQAEKLLPGISLEEINNSCKELIPGEKNCVAILQAPEKENLNLPNEKRIAEIWNATVSGDISSYSEEKIPDKLMTHPLTPSTSFIIREVRDQNFNFTEWTLKNGAKVVLKTTDFKNDEILFTSFSEGGINLYPDKDFYSAENSDGIIASSGVSNFTQNQLQKYMTGKKVNVYPFINDYYEGFRGSFSPKDMESFFQLLFLMFTTPRQDSVAFSSYINRQKSFIENRSLSPESAFWDTIQATMAGYHPRFKPITPELLKEINHQRAYEIFKDRFSEAGDFNFFFVGNISADSLRPYIEKYFSNLPSKGKKEKWKSIKIKSPKKSLVKIIKKGKEPKAMVQLLYRGKFQWNSQHIIEMNALCHILNIKLRESLREDKGGTYGVRVSPNYRRIPKERFSITINFSCDPVKLDSLMDAFSKELNKLKTNGATSEDIEKVKQLFRRERETAVKENRWWLEVISGSYLNRQPILGDLEYEVFLMLLDPELFKKLANDYFNEKTRCTFKLLPE
ncbi:MAG: hypothetical protein A3H98_08445 [Bacteroidetes bacterium RIFCSPLOWO2_02_FULL_36_8]|nr:MAG: hypothetical protein A3H98_08445 [Bacteroidetes bacterium RIFCSPLOWO2_02_FULL_36_8]OFY71383.1 MAG: hypothetical protein A3G23_04315 [Bacteroidetes bacterium RIFCSPLOWO2_12_FULL_37_12]